MIKGSKFFGFSAREMSNYLYDKFPVPMELVMTENIEDYVALVKKCLGVSGCYFPITVSYNRQLYVTKPNRIAKKGVILVESPRLGNIGEFIAFRSEYYGISICISGICTCQPYIDIKPLQEQNK